MILTRPTYPMYQLTLACLLLAGWATSSRAAATYTVTDLGQGSGDRYFFDSSGTVTPRTDGNYGRQQDGRYSIQVMFDSSSFAHSYLINGQSWTELTSLGAGYGIPGTLPTGEHYNDLALAVNASGTVVGSYEPNEHGFGSLGTAFVYYGPQSGLLAVPLPPTLLFHSDWIGSIAYSINDSGMIVGSVDNFYAYDDVPRHAFLSDGHSSWDLNTLLAPGSGVGLTDALDINAAGQIIAQGKDAAGQYHAYLLTPSAVPEPSSLALLAAGCLLGAGRRLAARRRG